jgi:hypothetical protein
MLKHKFKYLDFTINILTEMKFSNEANLYWVQTKLILILESDLLYLILRDFFHLESNQLMKLIVIIKYSDIISKSLQFVEYFFN